MSRAGRRKGGRDFDKVWFQIFLRLLRVLFFAKAKPGNPCLTPSDGTILKILHTLGGGLFVRDFPIMVQVAFITKSVLCREPPSRKSQQEKATSVLRHSCMNLYLYLIAIKTWRLAEKPHTNSKKLRKQKTLVTDVGSSPLSRTSLVYAHPTICLLSSHDQKNELQTPRRGQRRMRRTAVSQPSLACIFIASGLQATACINGAFPT